MKTIILFLLMSSYQLNAQVLKAPAPLTDSNIERKLESGVVQKFDGNEYMIVKRHAKPRPPKIVAVCVPETHIVKETVESVRYIEPKKNSLLLVGGVAPDAIAVDTPHSVSLKHEPVIGGEYQRVLPWWDLRGQIEVLSNSSFLGAIGWDF